MLTFDEISSEHLNEYTYNWPMRAEETYGLNRSSNTRSTMNCFFEDYPLDSYGFEDIVVDINPRRLNLKLEKSRQDKLETLRSQKQVGLHSLLDDVGDIINGSMNFNPTCLLQYHLAFNNKEAAKYYDAVEFIYDPDLPMIGKCDEAALYIRLLVDSFCVDDLDTKRLGAHRELYYNDPQYSDTLDHMVTLVTYGDRYEIINSKSPSLSYNVIPKDKLDEFGDLRLVPDSW